MKKIITIITIILSLSLPLATLAQPPHPNGGNNPDNGNTPVGGGASGAPVGSGTLLLTLLAASYAGVKTYRNNRDSKPE